jgi:hypothetical protein
LDIDNDGGDNQQRPCGKPLGDCIMLKRKMSSPFLATTAATTATAMPYVRGAYAAGKLSMGFGTLGAGANSASTELVNEWAAKEKVESRSTTSPRRATRTS